MRRTFPLVNWNPPAIYWNEFGKICSAWSQDREMTKHEYFVVTEISNPVMRQLPTRDVESRRTLVVRDANSKRIRLRRLELRPSWINEEEYLLVFSISGISSSHKPNKRLRLVVRFQNADNVSRRTAIRDIHWKMNLRGTRRPTNLTIFLIIFDIGIIWIACLVLSFMLLGIGRILTLGPTVICVHTSSREMSLPSILRPNSFKSIYFCFTCQLDRDTWIEVETFGHSDSECNFIATMSPSNARFWSRPRMITSSLASQL